MLGMWNVGDVDVGDAGCSGCGMFGMWDVQDVGCSGCSGCGMLIYKMPICFVALVKKCLKVSP